MSIMKATHLSPIWSPLYIHRRLLYNFVKQEIPELLLECSKSLNKNKVSILDIGCGTMPYRSLFTENDICISYEGADIEQHPEVPISVQIDPITQTIKASDESYDLVLHFQTLEHVPDPKKFIDECRRILRPGGIMFCTVPFIFEYHAVPRDFYRWTHEGLTQDLENGGFNILQIQAIESDWESILTVLQLFLSRQYGYFFTKPLFLFLNLLSFLPTNKNNKENIEAIIQALEKLLPKKIVIKDYNL